MATRRTYTSYSDGCAAAHALDIVGERWALIVVRELILGPKRFSELRRGMVGASPPMLTQRLKELEESGIVTRSLAHHGVVVYGLTRWGYELGPVLQALGRWGAESPTMPHGSPISPETAVLSMRTMHDRDALEAMDVRLQLHLGGVDVRVDTESSFDVNGGTIDDPQAILTTEPVVWASIVFYGRPLKDAIDAGEVTIEGDRAAIETFLTLFPALGSNAA